MNFWHKAASWIRRTLSLTETSGWSDGPDSHSGEKVNEASVLALSTAWACVNLLAGTIASLSCEAKRPARTGGWETAEDHPLHRLLHESPNADQTAYEFWEHLVAILELRGNFHAVKGWLGQRLISLTPIYDLVTSYRDPQGAIRYRWTEKGRVRDEPQENVFHVRGFGGTPLAGLSTLSHGREVFGLATAIDKAAGSTFRNGLRPSLHIGFKKFLAGDQRETYETGIVEKHTRAVNSGRPFVTEGDTAVSNLSINPDDAQMLESRGFSVEEVCRFFAVPPHLVGHTAGNTHLGSSIEQQTLAFQKFSLRRRTKRIEAAIRKQLVSPADRAAGLKIKFNFEDLLRGDSTSRAAFYTAGLTNGWMTINEVRALEGLPPVAGGEVPRMQMQNVPITQAGLPALPAPREAA